MGNKIAKCNQCNSPVDVKGPFNCTNVCHAPPTEEQTKNAFIECCLKDPLKQYIHYEIALLIANEYIDYDRKRIAEWEKYQRVKLFESLKGTRMGIITI